MTAIETSGSRKRGRGGRLPPFAILLSLGWGFSAVIAILAIPATLAALSIVFTRFAARAVPATA